MIGEAVAGTGEKCLQLTMPSLNATYRHYVLELLLGRRASSARRFLSRGVRVLSSLRDSLEKWKRRPWNGGAPVIFQKLYFEGVPRRDDTIPVAISLRLNNPVNASRFLCSPFGVELA